MIIQISGAVLLVVCIICGTWHWTEIRKEKLITERMERERIACAMDRKRLAQCTQGWRSCPHLQKRSQRVSEPMELISVEEVARELGVNPQIIRSQAANDVRQLGFPASLIGTRTIIPREGFFKWAKGETK